MPPVPPLPALQRQWTLPEQERKALVSPVEATPSASSTPSSPTKIAGPSSSSSSSTKPSRPAPRQVASCPQAPTQAFPSREQEDQQRFATHPYLAQLAADSLRGHGRVRSHFSIPDVMVTAAEEDGEETYFEVRLEEDKRRTQLFNHSEPVTIDMRDMVNVPVSPPMDSAATLEPLDEGAMTPTAPKRTRKSSLPLIFGRSSTPKPSKQQQQQQQRDAVASEEDEPRRSRSPYQQPAFSSSGSLPSAAASSRDSLPSSSSTPRTPPSDFPPSRLYRP
ncbi:hypothetical protein BDZ90DRAFT_226112 [Jaminaea rosea]|uniref:Uncharacterized protein n=1 Tax=Jaminaea rosea TaxID=1569628 RepID=A0A316UZZ0_9BASI|nr:hypothetical protein BDZ90DRAFT_226112 [Jaminaea rosea]PWN28745.1 hypothetical protein BDZ90DRAFT_226112 [Jaminaea rosea]